MKSFYIAILGLFFHFCSFATTWNIAVSNFSFNPSTVNAVVGDVIQFNWVSGFHTTTCGSGLSGTSLPSGAQQWDEEISSSYTTFSYTVTVPGDYLYGCTPHFAGGMLGNIIVSSPLPVKFGSFVVSNNNNIALLQWKTLSESNTDYFSVRRSKDGSNFYEIGRVNAAGNSSNIVAYRFTDTDLGNIDTYYYYEIVTVDADKKESFSSIQIFRNNNVKRDNIIVSLSPNPISRPGHIQLKFNGDRQSEMDVSVFNSAGQKVLQTKMAVFYGLNTGHLHICDLENGIYNIVFNLGGKKEIRKVIVQ